MGKRLWAARGAAFLVAATVTLLVVVLFFKPIAETDTSVFTPPMPIAFAIYVGLCA
jgi:hypothetical protein